MDLHPSHGKVFGEAIKVTPFGPNQYSAFLETEWCIGSVPHGGYTAAILYRLALVHFSHAHPTHYQGHPTPISMQLTFPRRTSAGEAILTVRDMKLGRRVSSIQVALMQPREKAPRSSVTGNHDEKDHLEVKVCGYITVRPSNEDTCFSSEMEWKLDPPAIPGSLAGGRVNLKSLAQTGRDGEWVHVDPPFARIRRATQHIELFGAEPEKTRNGIMHQWSRFRPGGMVTCWSNEALAFLVDMFPMAPGGFDKITMTSSSNFSSEQGGIQAPPGYCLPTVTMNINLRKSLPVEGVEWLYSRVTTKAIQSGRIAFDVTVLNEQGEIIATSTQVALVLDVSRNIGQRSGNL